MRITAIKSSDYVSAGGTRHLAFVDFELSEGLKLCGLRLCRLPCGEMRLRSPSSHGYRTVTMSIPVAKAMTEMALAAYDKRGAA